VKRVAAWRAGAGLLAAMLLAGLLLLPANAAEAVRIGVLANRGTAEAEALWDPAAGYLNQRIRDHRFEIVPLNFKELPLAVQAGKVDFVITNSSQFIDLQVRFGLRALATLRSRVAEAWTTRFGGVVIVRADNPHLHQLADLKGHTFMAVEQGSLGGFRAAWRELRRAGVDPYKDFAILRFGGTHDAVVLAVRDGLVDAGTLRTDILERMAHRGEIALADFRVLNPQRHPDFPHLCSTELYPEWPLAKVAHTSDDLARRVASVLVTMPPQSEAALRSQSAGWTDPADYTPVRELMQELRVGPFANEDATLAGLLRSYGRYLLPMAAIVALLVAVMWYLARLNRRLRHADLALRHVRDALADEVAVRTAELSTALAELEHSRRRESLALRDWHDAFDAITDPIFIHDRGGRIVHANPAYLARAGVTADAALGRPYWEVFPHLSEPMASCREFADDPSSVGIAELHLESGEVFVSRSFGIRGVEGASHAIHILEDVTAERRAEAQRRLLAHAVDQAGEGIVVTDADGRIVYVNPALAGLTGIAIGELCETTLRHLFTDADRGRIDELMNGLSAGRVSGEFALHASAAPVPVFVTGSAFRGDGGSGGVFTLMDLRSIKAAQQALTYRLAFESEVGAIAARFVAVDVTSFDAEMHSALARIGASVQAQRAYLFRYDAQRGVLCNTSEWCDSGVACHGERRQELVLAELPWISRHLARFEALDVADVDALPDEAAPDRALLSAMGIRSLLMVPLASGGAMLGILGFDTSQAPRHWAPEDIRLLSAVGEVVANTLRRLEAEAAVRRSEESLAQAQRVARLGNWDWNIATNGLDWSDEIYRIFGLAPQEFGATYPAFLERVHPDDRALVQEGVDKALRRERDYAIDHRIVLPDGSKRLVHERAVVEWDETGAPVRMIGTVQDVTEARLAERELQRLNRALRTLSRGNETLVRAESEEQLLHDICNVLVDVGGYRFAWVGYADPDHPTWPVRPVAQAGEEGGYLTAMRAHCAHEGVHDSPAAIAMRTGEPHIERDIAATEPPSAWRQMARASGFASAISLPLRVGGNVLGSLTIDAADPDAFDEAEVRLLGELADDLAFGITTARNRVLREQAEAQLMHSERRYHELFETAPTAYVSVRAEDGAILQANAATERLLGYAREDLLRMTVEAFHEPGDEGVERARSLFRRFLSGEPIRDQEVRLRRRDGNPVWVSLSMEPVRDADGRIIESRASLLNISARKRMEEDKARIGMQLQKALVQTIEAIAITIEKRDPYTAGHQTRVAELAVAIGEELGLDAERLQGLRLGAQIHDIGKIYVPAEFLNRPGQLSEAEFDIIRSHPLMGYDIVKGIDFPWPVAEMVVQHHERLDGSGYPQGLGADAILPEARIIAVADVVEAMASHRPYRPALPFAAALAEIERHKGVLYDAAVCDACLRLFRESRFSWERNDAGTGAIA